MKSRHTQDLAKFPRVSSSHPATHSLSHTHTYTHTHKHTHFTKTLTSLSVSKQASIEQVGSVMRDAAEQKKKGRKNKIKVSVFMRLQFMTLLEMVLDMAVLFVCLFVCLCGSFLLARERGLGFDVCLEIENDGGFGC
jgi:hypothetical protein